jgi:hypothetical protein
MTKQELLAAGYTEEQAVALMAMHKKAIDGDYVPKTRFNEVNEDLKIQKQSIVDRDKQIATIKTQVKDVEGLQEKITAMETDNKTSKEKYDSDLGVERKKNALKLKLIQDEAGKPHDVGMVSALFDMDTISLDENGEIKSGYDEQRKKLGTEKAFAFEVVKPVITDPNNPGFKPVGTEPPDATPKPVTPEVAATYGSSLAKQKLSMMGIKPVETKQQ